MQLDSATFLLDCDGTLYEVTFADDRVAVTTYVDRVTEVHLVLHNRNNATLPPTVAQAKQLVQRVLDRQANGNGRLQIFRGPAV